MMPKHMLALVALLCLLAATPAAAEQLTLEQAVNLALAQSQAVRQAEFERSAADWGLAKSISTYLPRVNYNWAWSRVDDQTYDTAAEAYELTKQFSPDAERSLWRNNYSNSLTVLQPIFNGGQEYAFIKSAAVSRKNAHLGEQDAREAVRVEVKKAYYGVMTAQALAGVARESLQLANESLRLVQARLDVGSATKSDTLRWEAEVAGAEGGVAEADNAYAQAMMQLARVIGGRIDQSWQLPELDFAAAFAQVQKAADTAGVGDTQPLSVGAHPFIQQTNGAVKLAGVETDSAITRLLPNVNFSYTYSWLTNDTIAPDEDTAWTMGVAVEVPLFQGLGRITGIGQSVRNKQRARLTAQQVERGFVQRAYAASLNLKSARLRVNSAHKAVSHSQANLEIIESRAGLGMVTNLEQLDARLAYLRSRSNLIGAISDFFTARAEWNYVTAQVKE